KNIPLVGFHDFLCVLMSGNRIIGKLSSDDNKLLPMISKKLIEFEPGLENYITLTESKLENIDAVIATGSNNTSRYFGYYFGKYPHIIRKNRNGIAVLGGHETNADLEKLGKDIFLYFGMGCRSVSKLYIPKGYSFDRLLQSLEKFRFVTDHHKYTNNYEYYKSIFLINGDPHFDNGFLLLKQDRAYASPPAVLFYEEYDDLKLLLQRIRNDFQEIQCIVSNLDQLNDAIPFGSAQKPELWDYADGVDTMEFLLNL
ncbi:MAG: acyl-CoA reductase, partial [Bacteroidetes bacterium]|nr:acyl-CoA reductase [Bacteroidota bacterium]